MNRIYQTFGTNARSAAYNLMTEISPNLSSNMRIGLKPNLVLAKESDSGATTDPNLTAGIIEYLQEQSVAEIIIMEGAWVGADTKEAFTVCGYEQLAKEYEVELYDLKKDKTEQHTSGSYQLKICKQPREVDYLINLPVLKAHCQTKMTCALKNLKGCIPDSEKRRFHTLGLDGPIAHLNNILQSDLIIVDGIIGDLTFEEGGNPVQMNRVLAGKDPVLIDSYVAELMGLDWTEVEYIKLAEELGIGSTNLNAATIEDLNQAKTNDLSYQLQANEVDELKKIIAEDQACSACLGSLIHALYRIKEKYGLKEAGKIYIGQGWQEKVLKTIGIGSCTSQFKTSVSGCPPKAAKIKNHLINYWNLD